jgi:hypothetical protein
MLLLGVGAVEVVPALATTLVFAHATGLGLERTSLDRRNSYERDAVFHIAEGDGRRGCAAYPILVASGSRAPRCACVGLLWIRTLPEHTLRTQTGLCFASI